MKRRPSRLGVVFVAALLSLTPVGFNWSAAADPFQEASDAWETSLKKGDEHYAAARYTEALTAYAEAVHLKPDHAKAHFGLINTYNKLNRSEEAVKLYKQAVADRPNDAVAHYGLGLSYSLLNPPKNSAASAAAYEQAIRLKPDFAEAHNNLGNH
jgi:tetratricopeptide (TPR) repeat protein